MMAAAQSATGDLVDMKLEVVVLGVSDAIAGGSRAN
jgi:hypothetical protein